MHWAALESCWGVKRVQRLSISKLGFEKDLGYSVQVNRSAKLKQCKLDARREQWLSQGSQGMSLCPRNILLASFFGTAVQRPPSFEFIFF